jgi:spore cortex biosynthesis protein YabQ
LLTLGSQIYAFAVMVCTGLLIGLLFDVYRVIRALIRRRFAGGLLMDLAFWLVATPVFFLMLLAGNWGELRLYVFLGVGMGLFVYFQLASARVLWSLVAFTRWLGRTVSVLLYTLVRLAGVPALAWREIRLFQERCRFHLAQRCRYLVRRRPWRPGAHWGRAWPFFRR